MSTRLRKNSTLQISGKQRKTLGLTLLELLVVVSIIGVLISLLLPAVQAARERARCHQCSNNLWQIGIALANYEHTHRMLPAGVLNASGPIRYEAKGYHMSWITQIIPFIEGGNVYRRIDFTASAYDKKNQPIWNVKMPIFSCPSDRGSWGGLPWAGNSFSLPGEEGTLDDDGTMAAVENERLPDEELAMMGWSESSILLFTVATSNYAACHHDVEAPIDTDNHGVFFLNSFVRLDDITDGLGHTIFVGEKHIPQNSQSLTWLSGTRETLRNTGSVINAALDRSPTSIAAPLGPLQVGGFSSYHPGGANFLFGNGAVCHLSVEIDFALYQQMGHRSDGELTPIP